MTRIIRLALNPKDTQLWNLKQVGQFNHAGNPVTVIAAYPHRSHKSNGFGPLHGQACLTFHMHYYDLDSASDEDIREYFLANLTGTVATAARSAMGLHLVEVAAMEMTTEELDRNADNIEAALNNADEAARRVKNLELDPVYIS